MAFGPEASCAANSSPCGVGRCIPARRSDETGVARSRRSASHQRLDMLVPGPLRGRPRALGAGFSDIRPGSRSRSWPFVSVTTNSSARRDFPSARSLAARRGRRGRAIGEIGPTITPKRAVRSRPSPISTLGGDFEIVREDVERAAHHVDALQVINREHDLAFYAAGRVFYQGWMDWRAGNGRCSTSRRPRPASRSGVPHALGGRRSRVGLA